MRSFFSKLRAVESGIIGNEDYSTDIQNNLQKLIHIIESGKLYKSEIGKFLCVNFRKSPEQLLKLWNSKHEYEKNPNTLRSQISNSSKQLTSIFGSDFDKAFYEKKEKEICRISDLVKALWNGVDIDFDDMYIGEVRDMLLSDKVSLYYRVDDCIEELNILKKLTKANINEILNCVDINKLIFLRSILIKPLIGSRAGDINYRKIEILKKLNEFKEADIPLLVSDGTVKDSGIDKIVLPPIHVPSKSEEYNVSSMDDLLEVFEEFSNRPPNNDYSNKTEEIGELLELFNVDGLKKYLSKFNSADIYAVLESIRIK